MRNALIALTLGSATMSTPLLAQGREDSAAVKTTARDYVVAWYDGNPALMEQVLHPELAKRSVSSDANGRTRLSQTGAMSMVRATRGRDKQPADQRLLEVTVLDLMPNIASAKVVSWDFVDYIHLARTDGRWVIINDLWTGRPR